MKGLSLILGLALAAWWFIHPGARKVERRAQILQEKDNFENQAVAIADSVHQVEQQRSVASGDSQTAAPTVNLAASTSQNAKPVLNPSVNPLPQLEVFGKWAKRYKSDSEFRANVDDIFKYPDGLDVKLTNLPRMFSIELSEKLTTQIRSELGADAEGLMVFQNQNLYHDLDDTRIDPDLPLCTLKVVRDEFYTVAPYKLKIWFDKATFPVETKRNFRGIKFSVSSTHRDDITPVYMTCGFVSDTTPNDEYTKISIGHLFVTMGFSSFVPDVVSGKCGCKVKQ